MALDQGTTSSRAVIFDRNGEILGIAQKEFGQSFPKDGWVEHDPFEIWASQRDCARRLMKDLSLEAKDIAVLGVTNQRETTVVWDRKTGEPAYPAIVWQDRRTASGCEFLHAQGYETLVREKTGLRLDPYFSATKVSWILDQVPGARQRAEKGELAFGTVDSWLIWNLTKGRVHVTDITNASRTLLFDLSMSEWDEELCNIFSVPMSMLPEVVPSSGIICRTDPEVFGGSIDIGSAVGDQQAATFGQVCFKPGMAKNTYGTGGFLLMNTHAEKHASENRLLSTVAWQIGRDTAYALEGSVFVAGAVVQWLRDGMRLFDESKDVEALARQAPDNGGVYMVPAFVGLGAPHWDPHARGLIMGLTRASTRAHVARAALESIAFQCNDVLQAMARDSGLILRELRVDGGASQNDLLMQFQADISGVPVVRPAVTETTALGAAYLAGLAKGVWSSMEEIESRWRIDRAFEPSISEDQRHFITNQWSRAVARSKGWANN